MCESKIVIDKLAAYRATKYCCGVDAEVITLTIDVKSDGLLKLFEATGLSCGVFITAFNPFGQTQRTDANDTALAKLGTQLRALSPRVIEGVGIDPTGEWPPEKSFLALGVDEPTARQLGASFNQDAVVWVGPDAIPRLLLLR